MTLSIKNRNYLALSSVSFCHLFAWSAAMSFFAIWLGQHLGIGATKVGILYSANAIVALILQPVFGFVSDKIGLRKTLLFFILAVLMLIGPFFIFIYGPLLVSHFYIGAAVGGISLGFVFNAGYGVIDSYIDKVSRKYGFEYGRARMWGSFGWACATYTTGIFMNIDPDLSFLSASAAAILAICFLAFAEVDMTKEELKKAQSVHPRDVLALLKNKSILHMLFFMIGVGCVYDVYDQQFGVYFVQQFASEAEGNLWFGRLGAIQTFFEAVFLFGAPVIANKLGGKRTLLLAGTIMSLRIIGSSFQWGPEWIGFGARKIQVERRFLWRCPRALRAKSSEPIDIGERPQGEAVRPAHPPRLVERGRPGLHVQRAPARRQHHGLTQGRRGWRRGLSGQDEQRRARPCGRQMDARPARALHRPHESDDRPGRNLGRGRRRRSKAKKDGISERGQEELDKLSKEFYDELKHLGVRMVALEKYKPAAQFTGDIRLRYIVNEKHGAVKGGTTPSSQFDQRIRLSYRTDIAKNGQFTGRMCYGNGTKSRWNGMSLNDASSDFEGKVYFDIAKLDFWCGKSILSVGRMDGSFGLGAIATGTRDAVQVSYAPDKTTMLRAGYGSMNPEAGGSLETKTDSVPVFYGDISKTFGQTTLASLPFADAMMLKGGDISCYNYVIDRGGVFRDERGRACDGLALLRARGMNFARIRNYVEPGKGHGDGKYYCPAGYLDRADNLVLARRAKELGMQIEYSFHYSDYWTNAGTQIPPAAWQKEVEGLDEAAAVDVLEQNVYNYTKETLEQLKAQGTPPEYVSIGNEIQGGMMYPYGRAAKDSWPALARFFNAGARAVREVLPNAKIVLHLDDAGNDYKYENFFDNCAAQNVDYDIIGCSYYPFYLRKTVPDIAAFCEKFGQKYHRPIMIMETGFAWSKTTATGYQGQLYHNGPYDMTKDAQRAFMQELYDTLGGLKDVEVVGDLYWDPIFIANTGKIGWAMREWDDQTDANAIDNTTLFDFEGRILSVAKAMNDTIAEDGESIVMGFVRGKEGRPIPNADVTLAGSEGALTAKTDRYGGYFLREVPEGLYQITAAADGYDPMMAVPLAVHIGTSLTPGDVVMSGATLAGTVTDDYGTPIANAAVTFASDKGTWDATSDAEGRYDLGDLPEGAHGTLSATADGFADSSCEAASDQSATSLMLAKTSGTVTGTVVNEYGAPVADVRVIATAADGRTGEGETNGDGWYEIANAPADAARTLTTDRPGFLPQTYGDTVYVGVRGTASASFQLARNAFDLAGTVKDIGGTPVPGAVLHFYGNNGRNYDVTADSEGCYTLPRVLADNAYNIVVTAEGQSDAEIDGVWYDPGTQQTLDITFPTPVTLKNPSFEIWGKDKYDVVGWTSMRSGRNKHAMRRSSSTSPMSRTNTPMTSTQASSMARNLQKPKAWQRLR